MEFSFKRMLRLIFSLVLLFCFTGGAYLYHRDREFQRDLVVSVRGRRCLSNQSGIGAMLTVWEGKNGSLALKPFAHYDISREGIIHVDGRVVDLKQISSDVRNFVCPEAVFQNSKDASSPTYRLIGFDHSGEWANSPNNNEGNSIACITEFQGRTLGKKFELGPDGRRDSAHHYWTATGSMEILKKEGLIPKR